MGNSWGEEKTRRPEPSGGEGGGFPRGSDRRDTDRIQEDLLRSASGWNIQSQQASAKNYCEMYLKLNNCWRSSAARKSAKQKVLDDSFLYWYVQWHRPTFKPEEQAWG